MVCLFCGEKDLRDQLCAAGESHLVSYNMNTKYLKPLTEKWKGMALQLFQLDIHAKLCTGNVCAIEIYYHKSQFIQFCNRYRNLHRIRKVRVRDDQIESSSPMLCLEANFKSYYDSTELHLEKKNLR